MTHDHQPHQFLDNCNSSEIPSRLPEINNNHSAKRVFVPVPTSITIINNDNSVNNYNNYYLKSGSSTNNDNSSSAVRSNIESKGKTHRRTMSMMPLDDNFQKKNMQNLVGDDLGMAPIITSGTDFSPLEKTITSSKLQSPS